MQKVSSSKQPTKTKKKHDSGCWVKRQHYESQSKHNNNDKNDRLTAFDPGQPG